MKVVWSAAAIDHLESIQAYIALDAPGRAGRFVRKLVAAVEPLSDFPRIGRVVSEGDGRHREVLVDPYRIIYRIEGELVYVVAVVHGARDLRALLERRQNR